MKLAARSDAAEICFNDLAASAFGGVVLSSKSGVSLDDGQDVVDVVRHAGGQLADRLHFLRLAQLRLQRQPFGDVFNRDDHAVNFSGGVKKRRGVGGKQHPAVVWKIN